VSEPRSVLTRREALLRTAGAAAALSGAGTALGGCAVVNSGGDGGSLAMAINSSPWLPSFRNIVAVYGQETGRELALRVFSLDALRSRTLTAAQAKSEDFTLFAINDAWTAQFYDGGFLTPLREIDSGFELPDEVIRYDDVARWDPDAHWFARDGEVMAVPINGNLQLFYYLRDLYDQLDLEPPETWDDVIAAARKAERLEDVYGFAIRGQAASSAVTFDWLPLLRGFGGDIFADPPRDWTVRINDDAGVAAAELFVELLEYGPPRAATVGQAEVIGLMQSGNLLQAPIVVAAYPVMDNPTESAVPNQVAYSKLPRPSDGEHATTIGIWLAGIPRHLPERQQRAAYDFLTWLMQREPHMKYAEGGGIVTRRDVYESKLAEEEQFRFMPAVSDSLPYLHPSTSWTIGPQVLEVTEPGLEAIASGSVEPKPGLDRIAEQIEAVVEESGVASA
jgi:multiple sugar transport system substrate-binding protein